MNSEEQLSVRPIRAKWVIARQRYIYNQRLRARWVGMPMRRHDAVGGACVTSAAPLPIVAVRARPCYWPGAANNRSLVAGLRVTSHRNDLSAWRNFISGAILIAELPLHQPPAETVTTGDSNLGIVPLGHFLSSFQQCFGCCHPSLLLGRGLTIAQ